MLRKLTGCKIPLFNKATVFSKFDAPRLYLQKCLTAQSLCNGSELQENSKSITNMIDSGSAPNNVWGK
ncbi:hypothetical protein PR048_005995 [Dryococelus australis]|uniref:Uncharacterized protein n=1 Tax=Dryococelus australis TaxID=614101 RepID=A0ABQ9I9S7_9NEOP|nr:hypothetical protein PR048_005995 [Dryococelus australis]